MRKSWLGAVIGTAALYFVTGRLGLLLAIPPGYATAIWPPSAVAAASALFFGPRALLGVWLGSFLVNLWTGLDPSDLNSTLRSGGIAAMIALGAAFQAFAARVLSRRYVRFPHLFESGREVLTFLALSGPVSCLINATWSVTALAWIGSIPWQDFLYSWGTWWVGDTIGVITLAPAMLILLASREDSSLRRNLAVILPLAMTFALAISLFVFASQWENGRIHATFEARATRVAQALQREMSTYSESLYFMRDARSVMPEMSASEFRKLSAYPLSRHAGMIAMSWIPRVSGADRARFEAGQRQAGNPAFHIMERAPDGKPVPAPRRPEYFPISYLEPREESSSYVGFDAASEPTRREALLKARSSGRLQATARVTILKGTQESHGVVLMMPVYRLSNGTETLLGFFNAGIRMDDLIRAATAGEDVSGLEFQLFDETAPPERRTIASFPPSRPLAPESGRFSWETSFQIAGRDWKLRFGQSAEFLRANRSWQAWMTLVAGLLFSALLGGFLLVLTGRTSQVERQVALRSAELAERTRQLTEQQQTLAHSSKMIALGEMAGGVAHEINNPLQIIHGYVEVLAKNLENPQPDLARLQGMSRKILSTVNRIDKIVRGLKSFARDGDPEPHELAAVAGIVTETIELCGEKFRNHGVSLPDPEIPEGLEAFCNRQQISQILLNLLNNAFFAAMDSAEKSIRIEGRSAGDSVEIAVTDSGSGVPSEVADRIFQPFFTTKPVGAGTGLGLSVSKGLAEKNGGRLWLDRSSPRTRFVLTLPAESRLTQA